jgi:hypothetical protein
MTDASPAKVKFHVVSVRLSAHASQARCKQATITLDTDLEGNPGTELFGVLRRK